jgi:hypothetical protein
LTARGQRVPIATGKAYLEQPGITLPKELLDRVDVIARSSDPRIASFQDQRILKLDYEAAILIAVSDDAPQLWCESILDWLSQVSLSAELIQRLSNTRWLRLKSGRAVKPVDFSIRKSSGPCPGGPKISESMQYSNDSRRIYSRGRVASQRSLGW